MYQICLYNQETDLAPCIPDLSVVLSEVIETGVVPDTGTEVEYNGIEKISAVGRRIRDAFDAVEMQKTVLAAGRVQSPINPDKGAGE